MRGFVVATTGLVALLLAGCAAGNHVDSSMPTPPARSFAAQPSVTPQPTAIPTANDSDAITWTEVRPSAVIDMAGSIGVLAAVTDGDTIWVAANGALMKVDAETDEFEKLDAPVMPDDTTLALADDGLWAARWSQDKLYRLDPDTGEVLLDADLVKPVSIVFISDDMWIGNEATGSKLKIDRTTGAPDPASEVPNAAYASAGEGDIWSIGRGSDKVVRIDPVTKQVKATIDVPAESNCGLGGTFPDSVWTSCFEREIHEQSAARIDPGTNSVAVVAELPPTHGGGVVAIDSDAWLVGAFEGPDGDFVGLIRMDPATGATDRFRSISGVDPNAALVAGDALWITDQRGHRLVKVDLADLE
jgi:hypothetical protein